MELNFTLKVLAAQLYPTLCDHMDCSPPGSSVHGIIQSRILEWGAISFSRGSSQTRYQTQVSCIAGKFFTIWATREALTFKGKKQILNILCAVPEISSIPMNYPLEIWVCFNHLSIHSFILIFINSAHINWKLLHEWIKKKYNVLVFFLVNFYITILILCGSQ